MISGRRVAAILLATATVACSSEPPPPWQLPESAAPPRILPPLLVTPPPPPSTAPPPPSPAEVASARATGLLCDAGFRISGEPRHDAVRLGLSCGPPFGFTREGEGIEGALGEASPTLAVPVTLVSGRCYRIVAAAEAEIAELEVELRSERDVVLAQVARAAPHAVLQREGAICSSAPGEARAVFRARRGRGRFAAEVWSRPQERDPGRPPEPSIDGPRGED